MVNNFCFHLIYYSFFYKLSNYTSNNGPQSTLKRTPSASSVATPFGLKAMKELQEINDNKETASTPMITFLVLNTAGVTIIPTTILALRNAYHSLNPGEIIMPAIIATICSSVAGLTLDYIIRRKNKKWR